MSSFRHVSFGLAAVLIALVTGCANDVRLYDGIPPGPPPMPTVTPPPREHKVTYSTNELFATTSRLAQQTDVYGLLRVFEKIEDRSQRIQLAIHVAMALADRDARAAARFAAGLPPSGAQSAALDVAAEAMVRRDSDEALQWAVGLKEPTTAAVARATVVGELVREDARGTIERISALPAGTARDDTLALAAAAWARRDSAAAMDWVRELPEEEFKHRLITAMGFELAQTNPNRAIALAETLPPGRNRWLLFSAIAQTWVAVDQRAALAWAGQLPAGEARDAALAGVDTGMGVPASRRIPSVPRGTAPARVRGGSGPASDSWPEINSPAFTAWLATQMPGMSRDEAILEYVRQRGALEPAAVGQLLTSLPGGPARQQALDVYVEGLIASSPQEAADFLRTLPRSDRNSAMIERAAERLMNVNPVAAEALLREANVPSVRIEQLQRQSGR